jgi:hypothetical protein
MTIHFQGRWPDANERALLLALLAPHIPVGETWVIRLMRGDEQVMTNDPVAVGGPGTRPMRLMLPADMKLAPRYVFWNRGRPDVRFSASLPLAVLLQIGIWYEIGPAAIQALFLGASVPSA